MPASGPSARKRASEIGPASITRESNPPTPPSATPLNPPPANNVNVSRLPSAPRRFSTPRKSTSPTRPASCPVMAHALSTAAPTTVSSPAPPSTAARTPAFATSMRSLPAPPCTASDFTPRSASPASQNHPSRSTRTRAPPSADSPIRLTTRLWLASSSPMRSSPAASTAPMASAESRIRCSRASNMVLRGNCAGDGRTEGTNGGTRRFMGSPWCLSCFRSRATPPAHRSPGHRSTGVWSIGAACGSGIALSVDPVDEVVPGRPCLCAESATGALRGQSPAGSRT